MCIRDSANNGSIPALPWSVSLMEDDTNVNNLTYNLSAIKADVDHEMDDLTWTVESTDQCVYTNYFTTTIVGDDLVFDLIEDATTNANDWRSTTSTTTVSTRLAHPALSTVRSAWSSETHQRPQPRRASTTHMCQTTTKA